MGTRMSLDWGPDFPCQEMFMSNVTDFCVPAIQLRLHVTCQVFLNAVSPRH